MSTFGTECAVRAVWYSGCVGKGTKKRMGNLDREKYLPLSQLFNDIVPSQ